MTKNLQKYNRITGYSTTIGLQDTVLQRTTGYSTTIGLQDTVLQWTTGY